MPHAGSPYWASVDFDSDGDEEGHMPINHRVYLDPWDNEGYGMQPETENSISGENTHSIVGEPVSASFYYVPTKNYDSEDDMSMRRKVTPPVEIVPPDYSMYGSRRNSRSMVPDIHPDILYGEGPMRDRRRSIFIEEPMYSHRPVIYEPIYGPMFVPPVPYLPPRSRMSLPQHPDYASTLQHGNRRKTSRMTDAYEHFAYETLSPEYEDWARPFPKAAPENFHLSRYGHLQIDYSCSWNSLDRLIRNQYGN